MLSSCTQTPRKSAARWAGSAPVVGRPARTHHKVAQQAGDDVNVKLHYEGDMVPTLATGIFVAALANAFTPHPDQVRTGLAIVALAMPIASALVKRDEYNWVASGVAPSVLAIEALQLLSLMPAAIAAFGVNLCKRLGSMLDVQGAFYVAALSLAGALYYDYGPVWTCFALLFIHGVQAVRGFRRKDVVAVPTAISLGLAYCLFEFFRSNSMVYAQNASICYMLASIAWSTYESCRSLADEFQSS